MNPYAILASFAVFVLSVAGAYVGGRRDGARIESAKQTAAAAAVEEAARIVSEQTAAAIAQIEVKHVTIRERTEKEIEKVPVLRDCTAPDRVLELTNEALAGSVPDNRKLSAPDTDAGGDVR